MWIRVRMQMRIEKKQKTSGLFVDVGASLALQNRFDFVSIIQTSQISRWRNEQFSQFLFFNKINNTQMHVYRFGVHTHFIRAQQNKNNLIP